MNKKYELTNETKEWYGRTLHRIKALKDFNDVKAGDLGGWIEKENNLSHDGNCWIYNNARIYDNAYVYGNARVYDDACVYDNAYVHGNACVYGNVLVYSACINNNADIKSDFDICTFSGFGTKARITTAYRCKDNSIRINCGCFNGTLEEFRNRIKETCKNKIQREYLLMCDMIEEHFKED